MSYPQNYLGRDSFVAITNARISSRAAQMTTGRMILSSTPSKIAIDEKAPPSTPKVQKSDYAAPDVHGILSLSPEKEATEPARMGCFYNYISKFSLSSVASYLVTSFQVLSSRHVHLHHLVQATAVYVKFVCSCIFSCIFSIQASLPRSLLSQVLSLFKLHVSSSIVPLWYTLS